MNYGSSGQKIQHVPLYSFKVEDVFLKDGDWRAKTLAWMFVVLGNSKKGGESLDTLFLKKFMGKKPKGVVLKQGAFTSCTIVPPIVKGRLNSFSFFYM